MTLEEAAHLLDVASDVTPEQLETRFNELRARLEDKLAKAPTPGLKDKYRRALEEVTNAFETLTLGADSSALPVLKKDAGAWRTEAGGQTTEASRPIVPGPQGDNQPDRESRTENRKSGKEFALVAVLATAVLAGGGWWVMKIRAENAEKTRLAAEARAVAEQMAATEKAEQERRAEEARLAVEAKRVADEVEKARLAAEEKVRQEIQAQQAAAIRAGLAELKMAWEATEQQARTAERRASELRNDLRSTVTATADGRRLQAELAVQQEFSDWLNHQLPRHPVRVARVQAEELLAARQFGEAAAALQKATEAQQRLDQEIATQPARLEAKLHGTLLLEIERPDDTWTFVDAFGRQREGRGSVRLEKVPAGPGTLTLSRTGWPSLTEEFFVTASTENSHRIHWRGADLTIVANAPGAVVYEQGRELGLVPLTLKDRPPGAVVFEVRAPKYQPTRVSVTLQANKAVQLEAVLAPFTAADLLADFMQPYRGGRWKVATRGVGGDVHYEDYLTVSEDGLTLTHHATNGPNRGTHPMGLTLLNESMGLVLAPYWVGAREGVFQVYRLKDDRIDWLEATAQKKDGRWGVYVRGFFVNSWLPIDELPQGVDSLPIYWTYQRTN